MARAQKTVKPDGEMPGSMPWKKLILTPTGSLGGKPMPTQAK
ncbi:MAG: hypothetical protein ACOX1J_01110 [Dethiobacteria bacterium]